ncbi:MAG: glycosyltransferase family 1 protein [Mariprofundales bacterium]|nr:glycosyltransferase family 1 protein [Mariprofundales bacterium]
MRIALDAYHAARAHGGVARYVRGLAFAMFARGGDHEYVLFTNLFRESVEEWDPALESVSVAKLNAPRRLMQAAWNYLSWPPVEYWTGDIDIYHGMHFVLPAVKKAKRLLTVHDLTYLRHPELFVDNQLNAHGYLKELPQALKRADAVIAVSESTKCDLVELMNIPAERVRVIYEGVEPHFFVRASADREKRVLARYGLDRPYLFFLVGAPEPRKNLERTVRAALHAAPDIPVAVVGPELEIRKLLGAVAGHVHFLGSVADADLPTLLHCAEIALYPSLYEGFGLPILESMAAGVPVITSNISSCPEVAGGVGVVVDPHQEGGISAAIAELLADEARRERLRREGEVRAAALSWQVAADAVFKLYVELS